MNKEIVFENTFRQRFESEIKVLKEHYENLSKEQIIQSNLTIINFEREKKALIEYYKDNFVEKSRMDIKIKV